jgi:endonuclease/exonuclease/phosphatase family metal-dependent hydrolase
MQHLHAYDKTINNHAELERVLNEQRADVWLLQEVDRNKKRSQYVDQTEFFASLVGAQHFHFKETILRPREDGEYGIAIVSKIPVIDWKILDLSTLRVRKPMKFSFTGKPKWYLVRDHPRAAIAAVLDNGWCVVDTHMSFIPFIAHWQLQKIVRWASAIAESHGAKLVIGGDFNIQQVGWLKRYGLKSSVKGKTFPLENPTEQIDHLMIPTGDDFSGAMVGPKNGVSDHLWIAVDVG